MEISFQKKKIKCKVLVSSETQEGDNNVFLRLTMKECLTTADTGKTIWLKQTQVKGCVSILNP